MVQADVTMNGRSSANARARYRNMNQGYFVGLTSTDTTFTQDAEGDQGGSLKRHPDRRQPLRLRL